MTSSIAAQTYGFSINADLSLHILVNVGFVVSGAATNFSTSFDVVPPTTLTAAAFNLKIQDAVKDYTNSTYGTTFLDTDIVLLGGVVAV